MSTTIYVPNILLALPRNPIFAVGLPLGLGLLSGSATRQATQTVWYKTLKYPPGRPPAAVFGIVWPLLYISMGYASYLAVNVFDTTLSPSTRSDISLGLALYYGQLTLNALWSPLFFSARQIGGALIDSVAMTAATFYMTKLWDEPTNAQSTYVLLPYCLWLTFATYLNGGIWYLNKDRPNV